MIDHDMIKQLAKSQPRYVHTYEDFKPGIQPVFYSGPYWDHKEIELGLEAFLTSKWLTAGPYVERFQNAFAKRFNVKQAFMCNSGSSANLLMIAALKKKYGWKDGDRVIVSPVGFPTTIAPLVQNGLIPVFVDIEWATLNFDLVQVLEKLSTKQIQPPYQGPIVGIFVSPVLGNPPNMEKLKLISEDFKIPLIGDNCDSLGSKYNEKFVSDYYVAWSSSFYPAHHICTGEGGMVCSNDEELISLVRSFGWWGRACYCVGSANLLQCGTCGNRFDKWLSDYDGIVDHKYVFDNMGYNLKPLDLQGAIGLAQLEKLDEIEVKRNFNFWAIKTLITAHLAPHGIRVAATIPTAEPIWFGVPIICKSQGQKESLVDHFEKNKIQTRSYFAGNILLHPGYKHLGVANDYPNANKALSHVFFLGVNPAFTKPVLDYIDDVINSWREYV